MTPSELQHLLARHAAWLLDQGGKRIDLTLAQLSDTELPGLMLRGAKLSGANLNRARLAEY